MRLAVGEEHGAPLLNLQEFYDAFGIKKGAPLWRAKELRALTW